MCIRDRLAPYADRAGIGRMFTYALAGRETRAMLRAILDVSSSPVVAEIAAHYLEIHRDQLPALLFAEDAKVRKSTAQLLGKIAPTAWADLLLEALRREPADMVRPSVILALGNCKGNAAVREEMCIRDSPVGCVGQHGLAIHIARGVDLRLVGLHILVCQDGAAPVCLNADVLPVSYTHLDVYKRQP